MTTLTPSPMVCDLCIQPLKLVVFDAATRAGPWANMCLDCFMHQSAAGTGTGRGQKYERKTLTDPFIKTQG